jgi:hypothetical protein
VNNQNPHGGWPDPEDPTVVTPQFQRPNPPQPPPAPAAGWGQQQQAPHSSWTTPAPQQPQPWATSPQASGPGAPAQGWPSAPPQPSGWANTAPGGPPAGPKRNRRKLIIAVAAAAVLLAAAVFVVPRFTGGAGGADLSASETVTAYLEALSSGDAEKALSYSKSEPANADLLTNEILSKQIAKMPISDIRILDDGQELAGIGMGSVKVAVKFGEQLSDSTVRLSKVEETWKIDDAINKIDITSPSAADETLTVFGKELKKGESFYVFPGFVDVGSSNEYIDVKAESPLLTGAIFSFRPTYTLNNEGADAVSATMADAFAECEKSNLLNPPGCPVKLNNYRAVDGTITWGKADLSQLSLGELSQYDMSVRVTGQVTIPVSYQLRDGGTDSGTAESIVFNTVDVSTSPPTLGR